MLVPGNALVMDFKSHATHQFVFSLKNKVLLELVTWNWEGGVRPHKENDYSFSTRNLISSINAVWKKIY